MQLKSLNGTAVPPLARAGVQARRLAWQVVGELLPDARWLAPCCRGPGPLPSGLVLPRAARLLCGEVDPSRLQLRLCDWFRADGRVEHVDNFFLLPGDWTPLLGEVESSMVMREARQLMAAGFDFRRMPIYRQYLRRLQLSRPVLRGHVRLDTPELIDGYFSRYVELFRSIQAQGLRHRYRYQEAAVPRVGLSGWRQRWAEWGEREIGVAIGENGRLYRLPGGQHRFAIATVLGLPRLPVQVRLIHPAWLARQPEPTPWQAAARLFDEGGSPGHD